MKRFFFQKVWSGIYFFARWNNSKFWVMKVRKGVSHHTFNILKQEFPTHYANLKNIVIFSLINSHGWSYFWSKIVSLFSTKEIKFIWSRINVYTVDLNCCLSVDFFCCFRILYVLNIELKLEVGKCRKEWVQNSCMQAACSDELIFLCIL